MALTFSIDTSNEKAKAFIDFIKTLDFIKIHDDEDVFSLSNEQKAAIDKSLQSAEEGKTTPHDIVMERFENRYQKYFRK